MIAHPVLPHGQILRHFTVAVFVVHEGQVLLHYHRKLDRWLPPGGHIEENELPDEAAVREVFEESGVRALLVGPRGVPVDEPRQLVGPAGIQLEDIYPGHQHIDLVYFATPDPSVEHAARIDPDLAVRDRVGWYRIEAIEALEPGDEMLLWARRALAELGGAER